MAGFVAVMLPLVVALGFWQLERAAYKDALQARYFDRVGMLPVAMPLPGGDTAFLRVRLQGRYHPDHHYLVDNRLKDGRPGYWVVSRFDAGHGRTYLVNRGWLEAPGSRQQLPAVPTPAGTQELIGVIWPDTGLPPLLADDPWPGTWPRRVQRLDVARMADEHPTTVALEVRLEPAQPGVFAPAPVDADFLPERHRGYAVQWFGLGGVLIVGFVIFGRLRARNWIGEE